MKEQIKTIHDLQKQNDKLICRNHFLIGVVVGMVLTVALFFVVEWATKSF